MIKRITQSLRRPPASRRSTPKGSAETRPLGFGREGWAVLIGPCLILALAALPLAWTQPLFRTELLYVFGDEVSVLGAVRSLAATDWALCAVVVVFGIVAPVAKILGLLHAWYGLPPERAAPRIALVARLGKFSMLDIMLVAVSIVALKGIGLGSVAVAWGLYLYAVVVLAVMALSSWMQALAQGRSGISGRRTPPPPG
jgi:uncharacterized paraquat-inducible protein A